MGTNSKFSIYSPTGELFYSKVALVELFKIIRHLRAEGLGGTFLVKDEDEGVCYEMDCLGGMSWQKVIL